MAETPEVRKAIDECNRIQLEKRWLSARKQGLKVEMVDYMYMSLCACVPCCCISMLTTWIFGGMSSQQRVSYKKYKEIKRDIDVEYPRMKRQLDAEHKQALARLREARYRARYAAAASGST